MKSLLTLSLIFTLNLSAFGQNYQWCKQFGGTGNASAQILSAVTDSAGNIYCTGGFFGKVDFDPGPDTSYITGLGPVMDAFVFKISTNGVLDFAVRFGGINSYTYGMAITVDNLGNIYFGGITNNIADFDPSPAFYNLFSRPQNDPFLCKLTPAGQLTWVKSVNTSSYDVVSSVALDINNNPVLTGMFGGINVDFDPGPDTVAFSAQGTGDGFVLFLDSAGNYIHNMTIGGVNQDGAGTIRYLPNGEMYISGSFNTSADLDPGANVVTAVSNGGSDAYIIKLDTGKNYLWHKTFGGPNGDGPADMHIGIKGDLYLSGIFRGTADFDPSPTVNSLTATGTNDVFYLKLDSLGNYIWSGRIGGAAGSYNNGFVLDSSDNIYSTGFFYHSIDLDPGPAAKNFYNPHIPDFYVEMLDSSGQYHWGYTVGGSSTDLAFTIAIDRDCQLYVAGVFRDSADFCPGTCVSRVYSQSLQFDAFIQKLDELDGFCTTVLPVELISFTGELFHNAVKLSWITASEINNSHFTIYKSKDGINYEILNVVDGAGNSTVNNYYKLIDEKPFSPITYYRLSQTDFDGSTVIAGETAVRIFTDDEIIVYWNNSNDYLFTQTGNNLFFIQNIFNSEGKLINSMSSRKKLEIYLPELSTGLYFVQVITPVKKYSKKIIVD